MTIRGVFLSFILLLIYPAVAYSHGIAVRSDGNIEWPNSHGQVATELQMTCQLTENHEFSGRLTWLASSSESTIHTTWDYWRFSYGKENNQWSINYRHPHYTSKDAFRILHQSKYSADGLSYIYQRNSSAIVFIEGVLDENKMPTDALFIQHSGKHSRGGWLVSLMGYDSGMQWMPIAPSDLWDFQRSSGQIAVVDRNWLVGEHKVSVAGATLVRNHHSRGLVTTASEQAFLVNVDVKTKDFTLQPSFRYIGPEFVWPYVHTSAYRRDRFGLSFLADWDPSAFRVRLRNEDLWGISQQRWFRKTEVRMDYPGPRGSLFVIAHFRPNQRLVIGQQIGAISLEWRMDPPQILFDWSSGAHRLRINCVVAYRYRMEYRYTGGYDLRAVYKIEPETSRSHIYATVKFGNENRFMEISYGESDRGQLGAKFDVDPSLRLAWGWGW